MKKIFAIISALVISASAFAANFYTSKLKPETVVVTDKSIGTAYEYWIEFDQVGSNSSGSWSSSVRLIIKPDYPSIVGSFSYADGTVSGDSYVKYGSTYRYAKDGSSGSTDFEITYDGKGYCAIEGEVYTMSGSTGYVYDFYAYDNSFEYTPSFIPEEDPYEAEPSTKKNITWSSNGLQVYSEEGATPVDIYAYNSDWSDIELLFNVDSYDIPEGDYEISASGNVGTIQAADGKEVNYMVNPSYFHTAAYDVYYLVSGTLTVSYSGGNMTIAGTATTAHGSTINVTITGKDPFGHELADPVLYEANQDGLTATVIGLDPTFTGDAVTIAGSVKIGGKAYTVTAIADQAFTKKTGIKSIVIPASIETIGKAAFSFCTGLESIECQAATVPAAGATAFYKINPAISVTVPSASVESYKAADGWKMFTGISAK